MVILRRTEGAMVRSMCKVKLVDRKNIEKLIGLKETLDRMAKVNEVRWYGHDRMAKVNEVRWYGHVIRRDDDNILKKATMIEGNGK